MASEIKLPGLGQVKTPYVIFGGALVLGIVGYAYYKHKQSAGTAAAAASTTSAQGAGIDPATGYPYGSPQDTAALAAQSGGTNIDPATGYPYGSAEDTAALAAQTGYGGEGGGYYGDGYGYGGSGLPGTGGGVPTTVGVPQIVGSGQATAIAAIQASGLVPFPSTTESGQGNVTTQSPAAGTQVMSGSTVYWQAGAASGGTITVPSVAGQNWTGAIHQIEAAGLKASPGSKPKGAKDPIKSQSPAAGTQVSPGSTVSITGSK